ncbi:MAG: ABC transporter permease [Spirochaetaceae bacterium]|jgi:lipoprotein-releasing system permease protein|nr:ABC transporter permease [Spirochaetaceae bacterium]
MKRSAIDEKLRRGVPHIGWIGFVASRYVSRKRRKSPSPVLAVLGIATGVLALTVILAVMNGFQMGFIESILEIASYHVRIEGPVLENSRDLEIQDPAPWREIISPIQALPGIASITPLQEFHALIRGKRGGPQVALIRGLPPDVLEYDQGMAEKLVFEAGSFDLETDKAILLGAELARRLSLHLGDEITLVSVAGLLGDDATAQDSTFTVAGIFRSGFYEYDLGWGFVSLDRAQALGGGTLFLGIKLKNRWQDSRAVRLICAVLGDLPDFPTEAVSVNTWRTYNRAFFGALRTEKLLMFVVVGLIFIVVGLNIFQSQRRMVLERREEIGLFRAVGAGDWAVRLVFVWDGFIIGFTGASLGMVLGLLIATHIKQCFTVLEGAINGIIHGLNALAGVVMGYSADLGEFAIFSPALFYIKEIPSRIIFREVALIYLFGFLSALLAAWFASGKVSRTRPAEVLRYE